MKKGSLVVCINKNITSDGSVQFRNLTIGKIYLIDGISSYQVIPGEWDTSFNLVELYPPALVKRIDGYPTNILSRYLWIVDDSGQLNMYLIKYFKLISELRKEKLIKLSESF